MKLLQTLGYFFLNKVLELYHNVLKTLFIIIGSTLAICSIFWLIGATEIALLSYLGFDDSALWLYTFLDNPNSNNSDILRVFFVGVLSFVIVFLSMVAVMSRKNAIKFLKENWEMAKHGRIYKHSK